CQVLVLFMITGFDMVAAGLVLERIKELNIFKEITEIYILDVALLGLKENLEMILASRLSTQVCRIMIFVIVISHKCKINPDNMVTPIAVSLSDLTTLGILFLLEMIAAQASRLSTPLHQQSKPGEFQDITQYHTSKFFPNPYKIFCLTKSNSSTTRVLLYHD
ncbi:unnamed protein product, partial [Adineta steineri]